MHEPQVDDQAIYRILSLDGGGIRGVFPAAFLARLEEHLDGSIGSHFDLITGTSTGGIIAIGLGLGLSACDILKLYEDHGEAIFDQQHGRMETWLRQRWRGALHLFGSKYSSTPLQNALTGIFGQRRLGESRTRLVIPAWHPMLERVYIYKTAHHPRLETAQSAPYPLRISLTRGVIVALLSSRQIAPTSSRLPPRTSSPLWRSLRSRCCRSPRSAAAASSLRA
jgi:patatin-like phospholipase/acyl hydrolase